MVNIWNLNGAIKQVSESELQDYFSTGKWRTSAPRVEVIFEKCAGKFIPVERRSHWSPLHASHLELDRLLQNRALVRRVKVFLARISALF